MAGACVTADYPPWHGRGTGPVLVFDRRFALKPVCRATSHARDTVSASTPAGLCLWCRAADIVSPRPPSVIPGRERVDPFSYVSRGRPQQKDQGFSLGSRQWRMSTVRSAVIGFRFRRFERNATSAVQSARTDSPSRLKVRHDPCLTVAPARVREKPQFHLRANPKSRRTTVASGPRLSEEGEMSSPS